MASDSRSFTPETARQFDRYSVANAVTVKRALPCGCEPYTQVFTYRRWKAQGFLVQRGEKAIRLPLIYSRTETDPQTGEEQTSRRIGRSAVFCKCQVKPVEQSDGRPAPTLGDCSSCGGWGRFAGGRPCRSCDGTGSNLQREGGER
jgi:hypothetical protein